MLIVTTEYVTGREIETIGLVQGNVVRSKNIGRDIAAGLKGLVGGELAGYTEMLTEAREIALQRMITQAQASGADAVVGLKFASSTIMDGAAEILAYGTAVRFK